jgi:hypothetical protein
MAARASKESQEAATLLAVAVARRLAFLLLLGTVVIVILQIDGMPWRMYPPVLMIGSGCMLDLFPTHRRTFVYANVLLYILTAVGMLYVPTHAALWVLCLSTWAVFM